MNKLDDNKKYWWLASNSNESKIFHATYDEMHSRKLIQWTSLSGWCETKEELYEKNGILEKPCSECGGFVSTTWVEPTKARVIENNTCFDCLIWLDWIPKKDNPSVVRVNGAHYWIEPDKPKNTSFLGFGGHEFKIKFNDGRIITTHNLWHQGNIPERFKERLPDNARFL